MQFRKLWLLTLVGALILSATGCSKSRGKGGPTAFTLKGAPEVIGALERADYDSALKNLVEVKAAVTPEQREEYRTLLSKVKEMMVKGMSTNEAAVKAYGALRLLESGR